MDLVARIYKACFSRASRSAITVLLAAVLAITLIAPRPARAQGGIGAVIAAAAAVVTYINNTIGLLLVAAAGLMADINSVAQAFSDLWQKVIYPVGLILQTLAMIKWIIANVTVLASTINSINVSSATLPIPITLETIIRNASIADFSQFDTVYRQNFQPIPQTGNIDPGDQERLDASDAFAMDALKALKASDDVVQQTLQGAQEIENEAAEAAPGSVAYLSGAGMVAAVENQAMIQRMIAAQLRQEAATMAAINALRKRASNLAAQFRQDATAGFH